MPNIASVLREELTRLARKQIKREMAGLRRASAQYRRDIAQLKRDLHAAQRRIALLESSARKGRERAVDNVETEGKRFSARGVKAHRQALGLSASDYGTLCGVSGNTVYLWESGRSRPRAKAFARWIAVRSLGKRTALARLAEAA